MEHYHLQFFLNFILFFSLIFPSILAQISHIKYGVNQDVISKVIIVDQSGNGAFKTIKEAIDSIPSNNNDWIQIKLNPGTYNEKVIIPQDKTKIYLSGESREKTTVQITEGGSSFYSATLQVNAANFLATNIQFRNNHNLVSDVDANGNPMTWAPAALINSDMVAFYGCDFIGVQDTITDSQGRHYYKNCYIEGALDFIWGNARSVYQNCLLNATATLSPGGVAYVTAQARSSDTDPSGFVFISCKVTGTGLTYLGRAYGDYSRVIFYDTFMSEVVDPAGWDAWTHTGHENLITFVESNCTGPGERRSERVKWMKELSSSDLSFFTNVNAFIGEGGWMEKQPKTNN